MSGRKGMRLAWGDTYVPAPGSHSARAVEFLRSRESGEATSIELRAALGVKDGVSLTRYVDGAVKYGLIECRPAIDSDNAWIWSLGSGKRPGDGEPIRRFVNAKDAPLRHKPGPSSVFDLAEVA
jgi:hypothetical protein